jgi:hypothetical protein
MLSEAAAAQATIAVGPAGLLVAAVSWGDWQSVRSVFDAVTLGTVDHWVNRPVSRQC